MLRDSRRPITLPMFFWVVADGALPAVIEAAGYMFFVWLTLNFWLAWIYCVLLIEGLLARLFCFIMLFWGGEKSIEPWLGDLAEWKLGKLVLLFSWSSPWRGAKANVLTSICITLGSLPSPPYPFPTTLLSLSCLVFLLKSGLGGPELPLTAAGWLIRTDFLTYFSIEETVARAKLFFGSGPLFYYNCCYYPSVTTLCEVIIWPYPRVVPLAASSFLSSYII